MKVTHIKADGLKHYFEASILAADIAKRVDARLAELAKTAKIKGFRAGHIPLNIMKVNYGGKATTDALTTLIDECTAKGIADKNLKPATQANIDFKDYQEGKDLHIKFDVEALPEVKLKDFTKIKIKALKPKVQESDVTQQLEIFAESVEQTEPIKADRKSKNGDYLIVDFQGWVDNKPIEQGTGVKDFKVKLGSGRFIKEFEENLIGKKIGEEVKMEIKFPDDIKDSEVAGKLARYEVKIKEIHEGKKAALDDELAKHFNAKNFIEFRKDVELAIRSDSESKAYMYNKRQLLDELDKEYNFEIPVSMVDNEYKNIRHQASHEHTHDEHGDCVYPNEDKKEAKLYRDIAERRVRLGLVLTQVGAQEKITVTTDELTGAMRAEMRKYPGKEKQVADYYTNNAQALMQLRAPIFEDKVVRHLFGKVKMDEKEITVEQLRKEMEKMDEEE